MPAKSPDKCSVQGCRRPADITVPEGPLCSVHYGQHVERKYRDAARRLAAHRKKKSFSQIVAEASPASGQLVIAGPDGGRQSGMDDP